MATTVQLIDGTNTVDLNDGSAFTVLQNGLSAPVPALKTQFAGEPNPTRAGAPVQAGAEFLHNNRTVRLSLLVIGADLDTVATNVQSVEAQLRRAQEFSAFRWGAQTQLKLQWSGATNPVYFNVLTGRFDPVGDGSHDAALVQQKRLVGRTLELVCEPYAVGAEETVENYLDDPGFEFNDGTAFSDWTVNNGTRSTDSTSPPEGSVWGKVTSNTSTTQLDITQTKTMVAGDHVFTITYKITGDQTYEAYISDAGGTTTSSNLTTDGASHTVTVTRDSGANTSITVGVRQTGTTTDTDDVVLLDKAYLGDGTSAPTTWISGRSIVNSRADEGSADQASVNFVDILSVAGDIGAELQLKATENEAHTALWLGARHSSQFTDSGLWHEVEDFLDVNGASLIDNADAGSSAGAYASLLMTPLFDAKSSGSDATANHGSMTVAHTVTASLELPLLLASVVTYDGAAGNPTHDSATFNGVSMTKIADVVIDTNSIRLSVWGLIGPAAGSSHDFVVTYSSAIVDASVVHVASYYGYRSASLPTATTGTDTSNPSQAVTTAIGDMVVGFLGSNSAIAIAPGSGETERGDTTSTIHSQFQDEHASSTSTTHSWTAAAATYGYAVFVLPGASVAAPAVVTKAVASPPVGTYRVLARVNEQGTSPSCHLGVGYSYGDITKTPSTASEYQAIAGSTFAVLDLGVLKLPPIDVPSGATAGTFTIRLAAYSDEATNFDDSVRVDWVFLLPVDFGSGYCTKTSGADVVMLDSRSDHKALVLLNSSDVVQSYPASQGGTMPQVHPEGTRLYLVGDNGTGADIDDGWTVAATVRPRYLSVAGP